MDGSPGRGSATWKPRRVTADPTLRRLERAWRWPVLLALVATIPAFYFELLATESVAWGVGLYAGAALILLAAQLHIAQRVARPARYLWTHPLDVLLAVGLAASAVLPTGVHSPAVLGLRLLVAFLTLGRMTWALRHWLQRGSLSYLLLIAAVVLGLCGFGYWWLEPATPTLAQGLWLAFVTAATVGYGDVAPTVPASKIFSVFVVMLGYGVLSLVTAAIATHWVETGERVIEGEILRDMHRQMQSLHDELRDLRAALPEVPPVGPAQTSAAAGESVQAATKPALQGQPARLHGQQPVKDE